MWVGTRFLGAKEAIIHPRYQDLVLASSADDTLYSELFDLGWPNAPLRSLRNATTKAWEAAARPLSPHRPGEGEVVAKHGDGSEIPRYSFASATRDVVGDVDAMALYAGEGVGLVRSVATARAIVEELAQGFRD